jgi:hypothetical protein
MKLNKIIFTTFMVLIANFQEINAMENLEKLPDTGKIKIEELFTEKTIDNRQSTINKLFLEFNSALKAEYAYDLNAIKNYYNTGYNFGDKESNYRSLWNWIIYTRSLHALSNLGYKENGIKLQEELDRAKSRLEMIDFYTDGKDYKYCLSGIWCIVSTFDKEERKNLLEALKKGEEIPNDDHLIKFFESFDQK